MCDLVYAIHVEELERNILAERQVAAIYQASGRFEPQPLPTVAEARRRFDQALLDDMTAPVLSQVDAEQLELRQVLGVAG